MGGYWKNEDDCYEDATTFGEFAPDILHRLGKAVERSGGSLEYLRRLNRDERYRERIAKAMVAPLFKLKVDYTNNTKADMEAVFPEVKYIYWRNASDDLPALLIHDDKNKTPREIGFDYLYGCPMQVYPRSRTIRGYRMSELAHDFMRVCGVRPPIWEEYLAFCQAFPEELEKHWIVSFDSCIEMRGIVPLFAKAENGVRHLEIDDHNFYKLRGGHGPYQILVVCEPNKA